jgi:ubiquinone/menaquinone biosynthesis C-methylase UbiE
MTFGARRAGEIARFVRAFHTRHPFFHVGISQRPMASWPDRTYHEGMRGSPLRVSTDWALKSRVISHYSEIADWLGSRSWYEDNSVVDVVRFLILGRPARVLELCCGSGFMLDALSKSFPSTEFVGVDMSPCMANRAKERLRDAKNVRVLNQDWIYDLPSGWSDAFDVIVVKNALHLLDDVGQKLQDLRRVSHEWTSLIIVETVSPNADANEFIRRLFEIVDSSRLKQNFFTEKGLATTLESAGWSMAQSRPWRLKQYIDTEDWLKQKCRDEILLKRARQLLAGVRNLRVRQSLDFDTPPGEEPRRMLRLQYIARHVFVKERRDRELQKDEDVQLQLV